MSLFLAIIELHERSETGLVFSFHLPSILFLDSESCKDNHYKCTLLAMDMSCNSLHMEQCLFSFQVACKRICQDILHFQERRLTLFPSLLEKLQWIHVDFKRRIVTVNNPEKGSNPRMLKISLKLVSMLSRLPKKNQYVFVSNSKVLENNFRRQRKRVAAKLENPRLLQIHVHTLRHWKGTTEYHKTKDPYHIKRLLGHKSLLNTEIYINIEQALFQTENSEFHVKVAETLEEACKLLAVGFEYVADMDGKKLFRKRK